MILDLAVVRVHRRPSTGLDVSRRGAWNGPRVAVKLLGFYATLAVVGIGYWIFQDYHRPWYQPYWWFLEAILPSLLLGAVPYVAWLDRYMVDPQDGYWHAGMATLGRWGAVDRRLLGQHALGWLVKAFFLPLMYIWLTQNLRFLQHVDLSQLLTQYRTFYQLCWELMFSVDLVFVTAGYLLTLRLFDSHIRSTDPTLLG